METLALKMERLGFDLWETDEGGLTLSELEAWIAGPEELTAPPHSSDSGAMNLTY